MSGYDQIDTDPPDNYDTAVCVHCAGPVFTGEIPSVWSAEYLLSAGLCGKCMSYREHIKSLEPDSDRHRRVSAAFEKRRRKRYGDK